MIAELRAKSQLTIPKELVDRLAEVESLLPQVQQLVDLRAIGPEILTKLGRVLASTRSVLEGREDLRALIEASDQMGRAVSGIRALLDRLGGSREV